MATRAWVVLGLTLACGIPVDEPASAQRSSPLEQAIAMARDAKRAGEPAERAASSIASSFRLVADSVLFALREGGYVAEEAAAAAAGVFGMDAEHGIPALVALYNSRVNSARGYRMLTRTAHALADEATRSLAAGLRNAGADAEQATADLVELGYGAAEAVLAVGSAYSWQAQVIAQELRALGLSAAEAAAAMLAAGFASEVVIDALLEAGFSAGDVVGAAFSTQMELGPGYGVLLVALRGRGEAPQAVAAWLANAGVQLEDAAEALTAVGFDRAGIAQGVLALSGGVTAAAGVLRNAGWPIAEVAFHLELGSASQFGILITAGWDGVAVGSLGAGLGLDAPAIAAGLLDAGLDAYQTAVALREGASASVLEAVGALVAWGVNAFETLDAVRSAFALDLQQTMQEVLQAEHLVGGLENIAAWLASQAAAPGQVATWFRNAGHTAVTVVEALTSGFDLTPTGAGQALKAAGFSAMDVFGALRERFGLDLGEAVRVGQELAYETEELVTALRQLYNASLQEVAQHLTPRSPR